jgi:hypothetical protein
MNGAKLLPRNVTYEPPFRLSQNPAVIGTQKSHTWPARKAMRRRDFIKVITGIATAAWPRATGAQRSDGKVWRVGLLSGISGAFGYAAFLQGMRELGHEEHKDFVVELREAGGHYERFPELARELVQLKVDVLLTGVTAAIRFLKEATTTTPLSWSTRPIRSTTALSPAWHIPVLTSPD